MNIKSIVKGFSLILLLFFGLTAQSTLAQGIIQGQIIDSLTNKPVEFAVVGVFLTNDTKPIVGKLTDTTGRFSLEGLTPANYYIKVDLLGYKTKFIHDITVAKDQKVQLGVISVSHSSSLLNEVVVAGEQDPTQIKIDKQVYKAGQFQNASGGTAVDVLKNMPSITVNSEREILLRGSNGFLLLINGKAVVTDFNTVLNQIPANSIENIEIITAPTSKYDADGKAGIINITTKKGTDDGIGFILNVQGGLPSVNDLGNQSKPQRYGIDGTFNFKKDKWDISLGASYQENDIAGQRVGNVNTTLNNIYTSFPSDGERSFKRRNEAARASITFTPNKSNSFSAGFYIGERYQLRRADLVYNSSKTEVSTGQELSNFSYFNSNLVKRQGDFALANLDYTHTFQNKSSVTFSGLYEYAVLNGFTKNLNTQLNNHNDSLEYVLNTNNSPLYGIRLKADYTVNIGKGKLESGYQFRFQDQTGSFLYSYALIGTNEYATIPAYTANIDIVNRIQGLYSQYSGKIGNLEYLAGLRYEYSFRSFNSDKLSDPYLLQLSNLFPSANLLYSIKPDFKLKAGFSKRVQRSNSNELNPYPEREHSETMEQGDPRILPEFVNLTELGAVKDFKGGSIFITFYNQYIQNVVNRVNSVYNDTIINRIYTNAGNASLWGVESGLNWKPIHWWSIYLGGNMYDYKIQGSLFNDSVKVNNGGWVYSLNTNHTFQIDKTFSIQFALNYISQKPTAQGLDSRFFSPNLTFKKTFFEGKLTASFLWQNIGLGFIKSNEQNIATWGPNYYTSTNYIQEKDVLWLNLSYNFKQTNKKVKLPSSEFGEKEF